MKQLALSAALLAFSMPTMANSFLGNVDIEDLIGLIAVLLLFSTPIIIVAITFWFNHRNKKAKYQVISEALAAGPSERIFRGTEQEQRPESRA